MLDQECILSSERFEERKKLAVRQSEHENQKTFQNKTSPQSAVSSGSEQQKMSKHLRNEIIENSEWIEIAEINFYFAIPWDIRRRIFLLLLFALHYRKN